MSTIINLGKIRFQFRGDYSTTESYEYNDVVRFGGDVYLYQLHGFNAWNRPFDDHALGGNGQRPEGQRRMELRNDLRHQRRRYPWRQYLPGYWCDDQ